MPTRSFLTLTLFLMTSLSACHSERREMERGPIGKADLTGSCLAPGGMNFCGGPSEGNCWCDDLCETFGDCCADKELICDDGGGDADGGAQGGDCCELADKPPAFEPVECCEDGTWISTGSGSPCADVGMQTGDVCEEEEETCCEAADAPTCFEGATCCADGSWACNDGAGNSTCSTDGEVCEQEFCGDGGTPVCFLVEPPCPDGLVREVVNGCWGECVDPVTCQAPLCCDLADKPIAFEPVECCADGTWASTGSGSPCSDLGKAVADDECQPAQQGEVCSLGGCDNGLACCYPCGIPGCEDTCMVPCDPATDPSCAGGCPAFP